MNSANPSPAPAIILTDNYKVVEAFNKATEDDGNLLIPDLVAKLEKEYKSDVLFLTNSDHQFISMEYQFMMNGAPKLALEILENGGFFEVKLFKSALANVVSELTKENLPSEFKPPSTVFYIAFGLGAELSYWSSFNAYTLVGAETFQDFGQAKKMTLTFVASLGLHEFSLDTLQSFLDPRIFETGYVHVIEPFRLKEESYLDQYPIKLSYRDSKYINARRQYRHNNFNFYKTALDNYIDKLFQTLFNTDNILLLTPTKNIDKFLVSLQEKYNKLSVAADVVGRVKKRDSVKSITDAYIEYRNTKIDLRDFRDRQRDFYGGIFSGGTDVASLALKAYNDYGFLGAIADLTLRTRDYLGEIGQNSAQDVWTFSLEDFFKLFKANLCITSKTYIIPGSERRNLGIAANKPDFEDFLANIDQLGITLNSFSSNANSIKDLFDAIISGYKQITGNDDIILIRETDTALLKEVDSAILEKYGQSFFNPRKPLVIFGSTQQIANYIYGDAYDFDDITLDINTNSIKGLVAKKLNNVFNLYGSQNVNDTSLESLLAQDTERRESFNDLVKKKNLPIFKYNTQNSNVISVTVNDNKSYFNLLSQSYNVLKDYASLKTLFYEDPEQLVETLEEKLVKENEAEELDPEKIIELSEKYTELKNQSFAMQLYRASPEERLEIILGAEGDLRIGESRLYSYLKDNSSIEDNKSLTSIFDSSISRDKKIRLAANILDEDKIKQNIKVFFDYMRNQFGLVALVEDIYANDPLYFFMEQMEIMDKAVYQIEIETLPYFPISNGLYLQKPCLLFAVRPKITGVTTARNPIDDISGPYRILGYYHKIDSNRAYSKFKLFRIIGD